MTSQQKTQTGPQPAAQVVDPGLMPQPQPHRTDVAARRVMIIGLDGATYDILDPMVDAGRMPNFARLRAHGASGTLYSTKPPITPAAWTTFMTGKNPGRHGIIDFERYDPRTGKLSFNSTYEIREPTIWKILSDKGLKVGSINVPMTFPPKPVNGFLITGFETPSTKADFTYPKELKDEILRRWPDYSYRSEWRRKSFGGDKLFARNLDHVSSSFKQGYELAVHCGERYGWDVMMVMYKLVDNLQHKAWKYLDPATAMRYPKRAEMAADCFRVLDEVIGMLVDLAVANDATVFVMSDHGHGSLDGKVQPNLLLRQAGFLKLTGGGAQTRTRTSRILGRLRGKTGHRFTANHQVTTDLAVDWSQTRACVMHAGIYGYVYINLKGRQTDGIVEPGDYAAVRDEIRELFLAARCRWPNGEETPAFPEVHTTEELYGRERHADDDWFPDLLLVPAPGLSVVRKIRGNSLVRWVPLRRKEGTHRPEGIFLVNGPSVRAGHRQNSQIADVTPTILAALGLPVPDDMDGSVITEVFSPPLTPVYETPVEHHYDRTEQHVYSPQEEAALTQRLADLGYL